MLIIFVLDTVLAQSPPIFPWRLACRGGMLAATLLQGNHAQGRMLSAGLSKPEEVTERFGKPGEVIAYINICKSVTVSVDVDQIHALQVKLEDDDAVFVRKLRVNIAYHSPHMDAISGEYRAMIGAL